MAVMARLPSRKKPFYFSPTEPGTRVTKRREMVETRVTYPSLSPGINCPMNHASYHAADSFYVHV